MKFTTRWMLALALFSAAPLGAQWSRDSSVSKVDDSKTYDIRLESFIGNSSLAFHIACSVGRRSSVAIPAVVFNSTGVVDAENPGAMKLAAIHFQLDRAAPVEEYWRVADDYLSMSNPTKAGTSWQDAVAAATEWKVDVPMFRLGRAVYSFKPAGMPAELAWLRQRCGVRS
jgi:hypothetical protein